MTRRTYLFDIDGTLANCDHRKHLIEGEKKDWDAFFAACHLDEPIRHIVNIALAMLAVGEVVFVSGRSTDCRLATMRWLQSHGMTGPLYMRAEGDHRDDTIVKSELCDQIIADGYDPVMVFDDRNSVVKMWRARGLPCAQVADGDF